MHKINSALALTLTVISVASSANTITDVGVGPIPDFDPLRGTSWSLSSSCVDINETGEAACQTIAAGPTYGCGFRRIKTCGSKVVQVHRWNGAALKLASEPDESFDVPTVINNHGDIGGYGYRGAIYPNSGDNGRIWNAGGSTQSLARIVVSINDSGDYIMQDFDSPGGIPHYSAKAFAADGSEMIYPGPFVRPIVISNNREIIGAQIIQNFVANTSNDTEIPEVSGVGWLLDQDYVDALELNEEGLFDVDGDVHWVGRYFRPVAFTNYSTIVNDVNDYGDFTIRYRFSRDLFSSYYCHREGETMLSMANGNRPLVPWRCISAASVTAEPLGSSAFTGINNHGDAVGFYVANNAPPVNVVYNPRVWLKNSSGSLDEYAANDLLPVNSGYSVISVNDINDRRDIVGTCKTDVGETRGCIIHVTSQAIPEDTIKPFIRIDSHSNGQIVSEPATIEASAWDDGSRIQKVIFKVDLVRIHVDTTRPFTAQWDPAEFAPGDHDIKATAVDNEGNRRTRKVSVTVANTTLPPAPDPVPDPNPTPPPIGEEVEGEGSISAIGSGYIEIDGLTVKYNDATSIKYNDVSGFSLGLAAQYKGFLAEDGAVTATDLEIN